MGDKISIEVTPEERTSIIEAVTTVREILKSKLVKLSPDERNELPRLGKKHHSFVSSAF